MIPTPICLGVHEVPTPLQNAADEQFAAISMTDVSQFIIF